MSPLVPSGDKRNYRLCLLLLYSSLVTLLFACSTPTVGVTPVANTTIAAAFVTPPPTSPVTRESIELSPALPAARTLETAAETVEVTQQPEATVSAQYSLGASAEVPAGLRQRLQEFANTTADFHWQDDGAADVIFAVGAEPLLAQWVYAVAAPFATIQDGIDSNQLANAWQNGTLTMSLATLATIESSWGVAASEPQIVPPAELTGRLWGQRTAVVSPLAIVPFEQLEPALKVLAVDGSSPLWSEVENADYPLTLDFTATGDAVALATLLEQWDEVLSNRETSRMSIVAMTGVTALTRATAFQMEIYGIDYPGQEVAATLQAADIAHVSHEVSFSPTCPYPDPLGGTSFCARENYFGLLQGLGIDVVELTGNHVNDYGRDELLHTIDLYEAAGMQIFGGGREVVSAAQPAIFNHNGNLVAFVGCNPAGPNYAWATTTGAGSNPCNYEALYAQIGKLRADDYIVFSTLQYAEHYQYLPTSAQRTDFRALVEAGAHVVSGSQGHHAMTFDLYNGGFIHYGPGNLFFDQMQMLGTRETFIDSYLIYDGQLLSVELWTGLIENFSRPRRLSEAERAATLGRVFAGAQYVP